MLNKFLYSYAVDYDYHNIYDCENNFCNDEGICRCGIIENAHITKIDLIKLSEYFYNEFIDLGTKSGKRTSNIDKILYGGKEVDLYLINRVLTLNKLYDEFNWEIEVCGGYYGQEIEEVSIVEPIYNKVVSECGYIISLDNLSDKVKYVLTLEYGKVLDSLSDKEFEIISINKSDIDFNLSNKRHLNLINNKDLSFYKDFPYYCGIVRKSGEKFRIIDGHHRISTINKDKIKVICVK